MSIALMTQAWRLNLHHVPKMVLLALCDNANDQGECFPSIAMLMQKCSMSERGIQKQIQTLEAMGYLTRDMRNGRSTVYRIDPRTVCTPAPCAPPHTVHPTPAPCAPHPRTVCTPTPAPCAPITVKEPSVEPSSNRQEKTTRAGARKPPGKPGDVEDGVWTDFVALRRAKRSPLTDTAIDGIRREAAKAGITLQAALVECCARGWQGFRADWVQQATVQARASPGETLGERKRREKAEFWEQIYGKRGEVPAVIDGQAVRVD